MIKTTCSFLEFVNKQTITRGTKYSGFLLCKVINVAKCFFTKDCQVFFNLCSYHSHVAAIQTSLSLLSETGKQSLPMLSKIQKINKIQKGNWVSLPNNKNEKHFLHIFYPTCCGQEFVNAGDVINSLCQDL